MKKQFNTKTKTLNHYPSNYLDLLLGVFFIILILVASNFANAQLIEYPGSPSEVSESEAHVHPLVPEPCPNCLPSCTNSDGQVNLGPESCEATVTRARALVGKGSEGENNQESGKDEKTR
jgi:hypothetical protein